MLNFKETFNKVKKHLLTQNEKAVFHEPSDAYYVEKGF